VDDARIQALTAEVLADLRAPAGGGSAGVASALEARVAALEALVRGLAAAPLAGATGAVQAVAVAAIRPVATATTHPSLQLLGPAAGGDRCVLEPDKPCVSSGQCRTFGH
jgi:hypothetical protein